MLAVTRFHFITVAKVNNRNPYIHLHVTSLVVRAACFLDRHERTEGDDHVLIGLAMWLCCRYDPDAVLRDQSILTQMIKVYFSCIWSLDYHHISTKALLLSREVDVGVMCREF